VTVDEEEVFMPRCHSICNICYGTMYMNEHGDVVYWEWSHTPHVKTHFQNNMGMLFIAVDEHEVSSLCCCGYSPDHTLTVVN